MSLNKAPKNNVFYRNQNWHYPKIDKGEGIYLIGADGKRYIDGCSGSSVVNIGHGNKEIAEYAKEQIEKVAFTHLSRWTTDTIEQCAEKVASWTPGDLNKIYFVSDGSDTTETALKMARQYFYERDKGNTSKWKVITKWNSFHGNSFGALAMTGIVGRRKPYDPMLIQFPKIPQFYHYRNPWGCETEEQTAIKAAQSLENEILINGPQNICAFISEVVVGSAAPGVNPHPIYFKMVREICDKYDILFILDEVMSGFGRTGTKFAIDQYDVVPDIICCAKGMGAGYTPIGATVATEEIFNTIMVEGSGEFVHGHTYASNPLSCGIALKVMEIMERDNILENSKIQGEYFTKRLEEMSKYPIVGDIRGRGLMHGIEFVKDKNTKEAFEVSLKVKGKITVNCLEEGLVLYPGGGTADGSKGDHVLLTPPLTITKEQIDDYMDMLHRGIEKTCEQVL